MPDCASSHTSTAIASIAAREFTRSARGVNTPKGSEIAPLLIGTRLATRMSAHSAARSSGSAAACCRKVSPVCASAVAPCPERQPPD